jgi:glycosyltransferase involved in cell wall biosynthesis
MKLNPQISIVIPNLHSPIIDKVIESLLDQTIKAPYEIIVVGQDRYARIPNDANVRFIRTSDPVPPSVARNRGVKESRGEILLFIDADCIADHDLLQQHFNANRVGEARLIGGSVSFPGENYWTLCDNVATFHEYLSHLPQGQRIILPTLNLSLPRSLWNRLDGFDTSFPFASGEDADFSYRARNANATLVFLPKAIVYHHPVRASIKALLEHAYRFGMYSIKIDPISRDESWYGIIQRPFLLRLLSPVLAGGVLIKMLINERLPLKYWHTLPIVYLAKIAWCFGAAWSVEGHRGK